MTTTYRRYFGKTRILEEVPTTELRIGDEITQHGCVLRIAGVNRRWQDERTGRPVVNFQTEWVSGETPWQDVNRWMHRGDYHVQGNDLARECRIVNAETTAVVRNPIYMDGRLAGYVSRPVTR